MAPPLEGFRSLLRVGLRHGAALTAASASIVNGLVREVGKIGVRVVFDSRIERMAVQGCGGAGIGRLAREAR